MTRREELQEAYEDAMFALLMDYVAESEGEKALEENRVLQEDPDAEVPQEVRRACLKEIHRAFRKKSARSVGADHDEGDQQGRPCCAVGYTAFLDCLRYIPRVSGWHPQYAN